MKNTQKPKDHPEVADIKNICDVASTGETEDICKKVRANQKTKKNTKKNK